MEKENFNFRTDMADERVDSYKKINNLSEVDGIKVSTDSKDGVHTTIVDVLNENGEKAISKKIGRYITLEIQDLKYLEEEQKENIVSMISSMLKELLPQDYKKSIIVLGLGNEYVTPDSLGPKVVKDIEITRHLIKLAKEFIDDNTREISALAPGVLGTTGIETSEIISAVVEKAKIDVIIAIDSLASQNMDRLGTTIQITNTGITPGSGVQNKREGITQEVLHVPVIAIGVPTVVDMASITNEAIDKMIHQVGNEEEKAEKEEKLFSDLEKDERYQMIAKLLDTKNYMVTPKDIDAVIEIVSNMISKSINLSLKVE